MSVSSDLLDRFSARVIAENPLHRNFLRSALAAQTPESRAAFEGYVEYCQARGIGLDELVAAYNTVVTDMQMEQIYFRKHRRYRHSRFSEVAQKVYFDQDYMTRYMHGLALTSFVWQSHSAIHDFFLRTFPSQRGGAYLEVGPGHGYYFMRSAMLGSFDRMVGVDVSAASVALTRDILEYWRVTERAKIEIIEDDFLALRRSESGYSCIVMGEVLEHVEAPGEFLSAIARLSTDETHIFVTTCINAPAIDHIYHFRSRAEVRELIAAHQLSIVEEFAAPYAEKGLAESETLMLPINVAYVLRRR